MVRVTDERQAAQQQIADFVQVDPSMISESPFALIGTPAQMMEDLLQRRERWGFSYVIVGAEDVESFAPVVAQLAGSEGGATSNGVTICTSRSSAAGRLFDARRRLGLVRPP